MAKEKALYAQGELTSVRDRLGVKDDKEAARLQKLLGGEVGKEKTEADIAREKADAIAKEAIASGKKPKRVVEILPEGESESGSRLRSDSHPITLPHPSYGERIKMDSYAAEDDFCVKSFIQVLQARFHFWGTPEDRVCASFVTNRLNEYYKKLEDLVRAVRLFFPRNNTQRNNKLKKESPFAFNVLNTLRQWKVETISQEIGRLQSHPRFVNISELAVITREIYKPLYILELLDIDTQVHEAFRILYRMLSNENELEAQKQESYINTAITNYQYVRKYLHYYLYPVLLKLLSDQWLPYETFFDDKKSEYLEFLGVSPDSRVAPAHTQLQIAAEEKKTQDKKELDEIFAELDTQAGVDPGAAVENEDDTQVEVTENEADADFGSIDEGEEERADEDEGTGAGAGESEGADATEQKSVERGIKTLEMLFPKAGWDKLDEYPDIYPYFKSLFDLFNGSEFLAPEDPALQCLILSVTLQELLYGFRTIRFSKDDAGMSIDSVVNNWNSTVAKCYNELYLPRVSECVKALSDGGGRLSQYASKIINDIKWMRRQLLFPYYQFQSITAPTYSKNDVEPLYPLVRQLKKQLTTLIANIDIAIKLGGEGAGAIVTGVENPWDNYNFELPNSITKRLNILLGKNKHHNVSLIVFTYSICSVLNYIMNNEQSWAYKTNSEKMFRSSDDAGRMPVLWVDEAKIDANAIFKESIAKLKKAQ
jgi:hypothetical protein